MGKPLRVLIVEDSEDDARLLLRELRRGGFEPACERVEDADAMSAALGKGTWDAILCDYNLPKFSAPAALKLMKIAGLDLPFILVSGVIGEEKAVKVMKAGAQDFIVKGKFARLVPAIERELAEARVRREHKRAQQKLRHVQKMEALGQLAGGIAHDFNNLLVPITVLTQLTMDEVPAESQWRSNLEEVIEACARGAQLVEQILAFSRGEEPERHPIELDRTVSETLKLLRATLPTTTTIREHIDEHSGTVLANPTEVHQVMMNLGSNAADAMGAKGGVLEVTLGVTKVSEDLAAGITELEPGRYVKLTVNDTGCGMDEETMERIFDPFYTTKEVGEGTGMGLVLVDGIVSSYGGAIAVSSEPGRGTTFELYFPLWEGQHDAALSEGEAAPEVLENQVSMPDRQQQVA